MGSAELENKPRSLPDGCRWAGDLHRPAPPVIDYHGEFDYRAVADAAPLPDNRSVASMAEAKRLHAPVWKALRAGFEEAWT